MITRLARTPAAAMGTAAFVLAGTLATELARPFRGGAVTFDAAVSVLYFDRIASGRQLEGVITTMPKPLLTVVYGGLHALIPDWRVLSWTAILAFALAVAVATVATLRIGGLVAAAFVAIGLAALPLLLLDVGLAVGWSLALLFLALAMLALTQARPRWGIAGLALTAATLIRLDVSVVVAGAAGVLAAVALRAWLTRRPLPTGPLRLLVSVLALPVMALHDWLLSGNPLYWAGIAERYSRSAGPLVPSVADVWGAITGRNPAFFVLVLLALIGVIWLFRAGRLWLAMGLLLLGPGIATLLLALAALGTFVDTRYMTGVDVGLVVAAAFGVRALLPALRDLAPRRERIPARVRQSMALAVGAVAAIACSGAMGAFDASLREVVRNQLRVAVDTQAVLPELRAFVDRHPRSREFVSESLDGTPLVFVPVRVRPHLIVDLELPMPEVASTDGRRIDLADGYPGVGQVLYHHQRGERREEGFRVLRITTPRVIDGVRLVPLAVDEDRGYWVIALEDP